MSNNNVVSLQISRDESTFLLNLVDKELERLLLLTNHNGTSNMSIGEGNGVYQDKSMCYRLALQLEESVK